MSTIKISVGGNSYVGAFITATDKFCILGPLAARHMQRISQALGTHVISTTVADSSLVGIFAVANSNGVLLPFNTEESELKALKSALPDLIVQMLPSNINALKNNILANDKIAIINPEYGAAEAKEIEDTLGVEVVRMKIAGFSTVGAGNILTNRGIVLNNRVSEEETRQIEELVGLPAEQSTANTGSIYIGLAAAANSNGLIVGETTTGYEMARMESVLF